jgi:hypothetical protein
MVSKSMKKEQLKQIIKEELQAMLNEMGEDSEECKKLKPRYQEANSAVAMNPADVVAIDRRRRIVEKAKENGCVWVNEL